MDRSALILIGMLALFGVIATRPTPAPAGTGKLIPPPVISTGFPCPGCPGGGNCRGRFGGRC
jgi:hypothetical protein